MNRLTERLLEQPWLYRAWQAPFAEQKFAPILLHNDLGAVRKVLDIGCGPGTNSKYFAHTDYLGIDINEDYIEDARRRFRRPFIACDVRTYKPTQNASFDFLLVNSFLHHLASEDVYKILTHVSTVLAEDGHVHILELMMPAEPSLSRLLARWDRGQFARSREEWEEIFCSIFQPVAFESYPLTGAGITLWNMLYFKGRPRK
ncbi:MAG TPA: class I SAM-dependent methyltransferase [Terriglobales bacterium]|nr:class I SAM-dependent methyltransferase [Terriglobales bacterium]